MAKKKTKKAKYDTFLWTKMKCDSCKKTALASTMDISADSLLICPYCGYVDGVAEPIRIGPSRCQKCWQLTDVCVCPKKKRKDGTR